MLDNTALKDGLFGSLGANLEGLSSDARIRRVLQIVRTHLNMDVGFVSEFTGGRRVFRHVDARGPSPCAVGKSDPLEDSYCQRVVDRRLPQLMTNAAAYPAAAALPATLDVPIGAHMSVPLRLPDGRVFGTFCCFSFTPDHSLNERDLRILEAFAAIVVDVIAGELSVQREETEKRVRIERVIAEGRIAVRYQPIYGLGNDGLAAFEALARFTDEPYRSPDKWFAEAASVGLGEKLELAVVREAVEALDHMPPGVLLSVNFSPATVLSRGFAELMARLPLSRLVLEVTEHAAVASYTDLSAALEPFRVRGLRLAVDDAGAGHASFRHVLDLRPDTIKLDMSLTRSIDSDRGRQALAGALAMFGRSMGAQIVAEGVETPAELNTLRHIGVTKVQGFLLGRPLPLKDALALQWRKMAAFGTA